MRTSTPMPSRARAIQCTSPLHVGLRTHPPSPAIPSSRSLARLPASCGRRYNGGPAAIRTLHMRSNPYMPIALASTFGPHHYGRNITTITEDHVGLTVHTKTYLFRCFYQHNMVLQYLPWSSVTLILQAVIVAFRCGTGRVLRTVGALLI